MDNSFCFAHDEEGKAREKHKPVPGKYDEQPITTCAWCGKTLQGEVNVEVHNEKGTQD